MIQIFENHWLETIKIRIFILLLQLLNFIKMSKLNYDKLFEEIILISEKDGRVKIIFKVDVATKIFLRIWSLYVLYLYK